VVQCLEYLRFISEGLAPLSPEPPESPRITRAKALIPDWDVRALQVRNTTHTAFPGQALVMSKPHRWRSVVVKGDELSAKEFIARTG
jgi:hypothetical protein